MVAAYSSGAYERLNMTDNVETVSEETQTPSLNSIADVFNDDKEETVEQETVETEEETESEKGVEEESESENETGESEEESPSSEEKLVTEKALIGERRRRQEAEKKLKELQEEKQKLPDPLDDPEGYAKAIEGNNQQARINDKLNLSRDLMLDSTDDYEEVEQVFMGLIAEFEDGELVSIKDPALQQKFLASPNPAKFAYNYAKEHLRKENLDSENQNLRKELDEMKAKLEKLEKGTKSAEELPDLTNAAADQNRTEKVKISENPKDLF